MGCAGELEFHLFTTNGEVEWEQGPTLFNPTITLQQYDGAGRLTQNVKWLSTALAMLRRKQQW